MGIDHPKWSEVEQLEEWSRRGREHQRKIAKVTKKKKKNQCEGRRESAGHILAEQVPLGANTLV